MWSRETIRRGAPPPIYPSGARPVPAPRPRPGGRPRPGSRPARGDRARRAAHRGGAGHGRGRPRRSAGRILAWVRPRRRWAGWAWRWWRSRTTGRRSAEALSRESPVLRPAPPAPGPDRPRPRLGGRPARVPLRVHAAGGAHPGPRDRPGRRPRWRRCWPCGCRPVRIPAPGPGAVFLDRVPGATRSSRPRGRTSGTATPATSRSTCAWRWPSATTSRSTPRA